MDELFIGIKGYAVCINKKTGVEKWRTKLKNMATVTNICYDNDHVYAYATGHLFCLDLKTGGIKWENDLPGLGHGYCIIASQSDSQQAAVNSSAAQAAAAAAAS